MSHKEHEVHLQVDHVCILAMRSDIQCDSAIISFGACLWTECAKASRLDLAKARNKC